MNEDLRKIKIIVSETTAEIFVYTCYPDGIADVPEMHTTNKLIADIYVSLGDGRRHEGNVVSVDAWAKLAKGEK